MRVYIAGPYTNGDVALNVRAAIEAADALIVAGHAPFVPHLSHFQHMMRPQPYETWLRLDMEWLPQCEALIRLPGDSSGADAEVDEAQARGMPVYRSVADFWAAHCL